MINDAGRPSFSCSGEGNTILTTVMIASPGSKSTACGYSKRWNLGDPYGVGKMPKYEIKRDDLKTSTNSHKEVRLTHSSEETG